MKNSEIMKYKNKSNELEEKENTKAIRIHQLLLSLIKNEIKEKNKNLTLFFSSKIESKKENNILPSKKNISNNSDHNSGETDENSDFEESFSNEDNSSDMSCEEEIIF